MSESHIDLIYILVGGMLEISMVSIYPKKSKEILNNANNIFINENIQALSEVATRSLNFISNQLTSVESILTNQKQELSDFQKDNTTFNVDIESRRFRV